MEIRRMMFKPQQIALFALSLFMFASCGKKQQGGMPTGPQEHAVTTLQPTSTELKSSYPATIRGKQDVEIRPKVTGFITQLCVDEGATVRKGQPLFLIDKVEFEAAVKAAQASVKVAEANVKTQELTVKNKRELQKKNIISEYDLQMAENLLDSYKATLAQANAQLVNARNNLSYTTVTSPSNGVVGTIPFRVGSLVSGSSTTPLTTVSEISDMYIYFSMDEKQLLNMIREGGSIKDILSKMPAVELQLADGSIYPEKGKIETVSGVIDQATGSVSMRALFPNARNIMRSGGTGVILIPYQVEDAILIPQKATYEIQDKKFVYVVGPDSKVKNTEITISNLDDGKNYLVTSGLKAGDRLVVDGVSSLKDGAEIKAITPQEAQAKLKAMTQGAAAQPAKK